MRRSCWIVAAVWLAVFAGRAQAHFLFVRILPPAEGGRAAELYFSEYAQAGDPRYIDKVAPAKLFVQSTPGDFRPLEVQKLSDRLRAHLPLEGTVMVAGELDYGVLTRPMLAPFLLRHYSKAVAGKPDEINRLQAKGSPLENAVYNGNELGSGSIRITDPALQSMVFRFLGISPEDQRRRFGFLLDALAAGAPPHGGFALGFDRIAMLLAGATSLRDVIAFPKTAAARALFEGAPTRVDAAELTALHLRTIDRP